MLFSLKPKQDANPAPAEEETVGTLSPEEREAREKKLVKRQKSLRRQGSAYEVLFGASKASDSEEDGLE